MTKSPAAVQEREKLDETVKAQTSEMRHPVPCTEFVALEGEEVVCCAMCRREIKVWWFVDENGLVTFGAGPAIGDELRYQRWLEQNRPLQGDARLSRELSPPAHRSKH